VDDATLAARRYSGTFDIDDLNSLEDVLANERDIMVNRRGEAIVIRRRMISER
jgi:ferric-dicitrate binding protein FerR (iron transport regulator)